MCILICIYIKIGELYTSQCRVCMMYLKPLRWLRWPVNQCKVWRGDILQPGAAVVTLILSALILSHALLLAAWLAVTGVVRCGDNGHYSHTFETRKVGRLCFQYYLFITKKNGQNLVNFVNVHTETSANFAGRWCLISSLQRKHIEHILFLNMKSYRYVKLC